MSQATHNDDRDGRWRRLWEVADMVALREAVEPKAGNRGQYKKQISD
jgi:hypothetical protein